MVPYSDFKGTPFFDVEYLWNYKIQTQLQWNTDINVHNAILEGAISHDMSNSNIFN